MQFSRQQIAKKINEWRSILGIEKRWVIKFDIKDSSSKMTEGNESAMACIEIELGYFYAYLQFNAPEIDEDELDEVVLHELLHLQLEPLSLSNKCGLGEDFEDMNTVLTESTIERLMTGYLTLYKKAHRKNK
jgi:hypothetical protein